MSEPRPAHIGKDPVLWFGTVATPTAVVAVVATASGRLGVAPLETVHADVRHVSLLESYPGVGRSGPGWIDLEDMVPETVSLDEAKAAAVAALADPTPVDPSTRGVEGVDFILDKEGNKYDPTSGKPLE